jgi:hypothetical protein
MPTLAQMYATVNAKTSYSRKDEIYSALSEGGWLVYSAVLKETAGFFIKFDTTTITLMPGQQEYTMPPDLTSLLNIAERLTTAERWRTIEPTSLRDAMDNTQNMTGWDLWCDYYADSMFRFYGPYLPAGAVNAAQTMKITVTPQIDQIRMCEIAYTAKWLPITNANSIVMLPDEGTYAMQNYAIAEINRANDNTLSREYEAKGDKHLSAFLTWVRQRQTVQRPRITAYLED